MTPELLEQIDAVVWAFRTIAFASIVGVFFYMGMKVFHDD